MPAAISVILHLCTGAKLFTILRIRSYVYFHFIHYVLYRIMLLINVVSLYLNSLMYVRM
jgi:hypothetical protein